MPFDSATRNRLATFVREARTLIADEFTQQFQALYGISTSGAMTPLDQLTHLDEAGRATAALLRERIDYLIGSYPSEKNAAASAVSRLAREQSFTILNRLAAIRMAEKRKLIVESVGKGYQSAGFRVYEQVAGTGLGDSYQRYRFYLFCLFDELAVDLGVLFDRRSGSGILFPQEPALLRLLQLLNAHDIEALWAEDETIGWIYQYFNDEAERKKMREESSAPRNSRELAVRNQFFTPRYVVEFLTDNTLGRLWYEMTQGETRLKEQCRYLVRRPTEIFLKPGESAPESAGSGEAENLSQEELFRQPVHIPHRPIKDPREIRLLDPACGSMHFGLYAFDLFEVIYREAWQIPELRGRLAEAYGYGEPGELIAVPDSVRLRTGATASCFASGRKMRVEDATLVLARYEEGHIAGRPLIYHPDEVASRRAAHSQEMPLRDFDYARAVAGNWFAPGTGLSFLEIADCFDFQTQPAKTLDEALAAYERDIPRLIVERNIHGIDIDPRAAQIAGLSLWLRAQRAWHQAGVMPADRPPITRSNLVCAEPMPGDKGLLREFVDQQFPAGERPAYSFLLETIFDRMTLAGEAGSLLRIEEEIRTAIADAKRLWKEGPKVEQATMFPESGEKAGQREMRLDLSGITDEQFWERAEQRIYDALEAYAGQAENAGGFQRRLFADDAAQGFAFIDLCRKRYDVVVMNPPFGEATADCQKLLGRFPKGTPPNLYALFMVQAARFTNENGAFGAISDSTFLKQPTFLATRHLLLSNESPLYSLVDLGWGVLDANVRTAVSVVQKRNIGGFYALDIADQENRGDILFNAVTDFTFAIKSHAEVFALPKSVFALNLSIAAGRELVGMQSLGKLCSLPWGCGANDAFRLFRLRWELSASETRKRWAFLTNGGSFSPFYRENFLLCRREMENGESAFTMEFREGTDRLYDAAGRELYYRLGLTYPKRSEFFHVSMLPKGHIFTPEGKGLFLTDSTEIWLHLGVLNSSFVASIAGIVCGPHKQRGDVELIKVPNIGTEAAVAVAQESKSVFELGRAMVQSDENSAWFLYPGAPNQRPCAAESIQQFTKQHDSELARACDSAAASMRAIDSRVLSAVPLELRNFCDNQGIDEQRCRLWKDISLSANSIASFAFGTAFGRWDIRYATGERPAPELPDPFAPLPVCPSGMLQGDDGLPLSPEAGRRSRAEGGYPLDVAWDGILVDDPEDPLDLKHRSDADIERRVQAALSVLWGDRADALEHEACALLGVPTLREWFRRPTGFFADHLKRYSRSRRQAPIYWPLSTASGSYTLWIYYHRLTDQTLHTALADFLNPKIRNTEKAYHEAREANRTSRAGELGEFLDELKQMRAEIERIIRLPWRPNLNDGVLITACPLWSLFRLGKWQKDLKACLQELENGDYDWAHLAYALRPEQVRQKCKKDRSLAIAHGLESICEVAAPTPKAPRRPKNDGALKELEAKKEVIREELTEALCLFTLGERLPLDVVNGQTGEIIIPANRKITKTLIRKLVAAHSYVEIEPSPLRNRVREIIAPFAARLAELEQSDGSQESNPRIFQ